LKKDMRCKFRARAVAASLSFNHVTLGSDNAQVQLAFPKIETEAEFSLTFAAAAGHAPKSGYARLCTSARNKIGAAGPVPK
jgi:hypothetical protein